MQIFFLSEKWVVMLFFILWFIFQLSAARISHLLPDKWLDPKNVLFRPRKWEKDGKLYERVFKIKSWKEFLPDGAAVSKTDYRKKNIRDFSYENLNLFLKESCRAELSHILAIFPFWIFGLFAPLNVVPIMLAYALIVNIPCIIAQRYNRPRILRILELKKRQNNHQVK